MSTRTLPAGAKFADWSWARGCIAPLQAAGVEGGSRYLSPSFQAQVTSGKCFSIPERDEGFAAGFAWLMNWENAATDALGGAAAGKVYGAICYTQLRTLEYPVDERLKITVSCDTDARNQLRTVNAYYTAFQAELREYGPQMNAYGGSFVLDSLDWCGPHWLTTSRAWSDPAVWAAINRGDLTNPLLDNICAYQTPIGSTAAWDMDVTIKPVTVWTGLGADPDAPITPLSEEDHHMKLIFTTDNLGIWMIHNGAIVQLSGPQYEALVKAGVPTPADQASWLNAGELDELKALFPGTQAAAAVAPGGPHNVSGTFTGSTDG